MRLKDFSLSTSGMQISWECIVHSIPCLNVKSTLVTVALPKLLDKFGLMLLVRLWVFPELFSDLMGILIHAS